MAVSLSRLFVGLESFGTLKYIGSQLLRPTVENVKYKLYAHSWSTVPTKWFVVCGHNANRWFTQQRLNSSVPVDPVGSPKILHDPYQLVQDDMVCLFDDILHELRVKTVEPSLQTISTYYFGAQGKALRPLMVMLMSKVINVHLCKGDSLLKNQRELAMIAEMIHAATLVHDDLIDQSDFRRGKPSINILWNPRQVAMAGNYILAIATMMLSRMQNDNVTLVISQIISNLVQGEFMQLRTELTTNDRFSHYLRKTYLKTASLFANTCKATAILAGANEEVADIAFQYGRNIGIAFQLIDDLLDFVSSSDNLGKPVAVDLKLGLATAPVLFACEKYPELHLMILRHFKKEGDVETALNLVHQSHGLEETRILAQKYCKEAIRYAKMLEESPYQQALQVLCDLILKLLK